jgi:hypothetical protein
MRRGAHGRPVLAQGRSSFDAAEVLGYVIEWGPQRASVAKSFHPDYPDMAPIIEEVTAALLAFSAAVAHAITDTTGAAAS